ncbi:Hydrolase_4 domain-containing protein [Rubrivivax sp. A210]|uniref:alpha/beta hydrolase n=1 Tax=Rubrivivax sp. A210 TaxID=2772301 RepID=UPI0019185075|nr:alpha/beta fold hydrolase [Rubrivivax sp. A210]CAD5374900.1 Hydrolase_4 domain-containing protein [Rubrivivax sp. A210]
MGVIEMAPLLARAAAWGGGLLLLAGTLYALALAVLWWGQERLLFQPEVLAATHRFDFGADVHEDGLDVPGARLHALHLRLPHPAGVVFYLHGNAGSLQSWFTNADFYRRANFDLYMIDYRGYGKSSGRIESQAQLLDDVRAAWAWVAPRYAGLKRVIYGRSLGSGLAAMLAAEVQPELTVLASPYASMARLAAEHYAWVPQALLRYPLRTDEAVPHIRGPLLLVHGQRDDLIAPAHSEHLATLAPQARLLRLPEAGHNDLQLHAAYLETLAVALAGR